MMSSKCEVDHRSFPEVALPVRTHSKYDAVTPPALARMSGITKTCLSPRMSSAAAVAGPLAPSSRDSSLPLLGMRRVDDVPRGRRNQDFAISDQQLFRVRALGALEAVDGAFLLAIFPQRRNVDAFAVVQAAIRSEERRVGKECRSRWSPY